MICPNCKEYMNLAYFNEDEVEEYDCDKCNIQINVSISYDIDCMSQEHGYVQHEVDFSDWEQAKSVMKWIRESGQQIISVGKKETQVKLEYIEVEDFLKLSEKNGIGL